MKVINVILLVINRSALHVFAGCESGTLRGDVLIEGDHENCTIKCNNVTVTWTAPNDGAYKCQFKFDSKIAFLETITNLTFKGTNAFSFVSINDNIAIRYPINVGGEVLLVAKEYDYPRVLGGFYASAKNGTGNPGIEFTILCTFLLVQ